LAVVLCSIRSIIENHAAEMNVDVSFAAKPFANQPSSGLHIHTHLADEQGLNVFHKTEDWTGDYLRHSLGGLLARMPSHMLIFFPNDADVARLDDVDHVPKIFGWGVNNRYCALRIPMDPDLYNKRIEHRVPCANANPKAVIEAILAGILHGLRERIEPPEQEHGKFSTIDFKQALTLAAIC
jgi:glutamine synthetase